MGPQSWQTYNSQTLRHTFGQTALLAHLHKNVGFDEASAAWKTWFLPEGQVVRERSDGFVGLVLKVVEGAALLWPVSRLASETWALDREATELAWLFVFDFDGLEVLQGQLQPPIAMKLAGWANLQKPVWKGGSWVSLMDWQAPLAYSGVPEAALRPHRGCGLPRWYEVWR